MTAVWMPVAPMRFVERDIPDQFDGTYILTPKKAHILQQLWGEHRAYRYESGTKMEPTGRYRWEDVPLMDEADPGLDCWSKP